MTAAEAEMDRALDRAWMRGVPHDEVHALDPRTGCTIAPERDRDWYRDRPVAWEALLAAADAVDRYLAEVARADDR